MITKFKLFEQFEDDPFGEDTYYPYSSISIEEACEIAKDYIKNNPNNSLYDFHSILNLRDGDPIVREAETIFCDKIPNKYNKIYDDTIDYDSITSGSVVKCNIPGVSDNPVIKTIDRVVHRSTTSSHIPYSLVGGFGIFIFNIRSVIKY
jgi:hypothetical protein